MNKSNHAHLNAVRGNVKIVLIDADSYSRKVRRSRDHSSRRVLGDSCSIDKFNFRTLSKGTVEDSESSADDSTASYYLHTAFGEANSVLLSVAAATSRIGSS